jgi:hypothetical protein
MIVVECYSDKFFINRLLPREKIIHAFSKGKVLSHIDEISNIVGLIDADPYDSQPGALRNYDRIEETNGMAILTKKGNNTNKLIELNPRFEEWIIKRAEQNGISLRQFDLPETASELHNIKRIDKDPRFLRLIDSLIARDPELERIKTVIREVSE